MGLNSTNSLAIAFNKLSGKVHTQQNFAVTEEGISTNVQQSFSTVFANPIVKLPVTASGMSSLYSTNGIVERVKFQIDIIPDTQIAVGRSQGYRLKLPSDYNTFGELYPQFSAGTYLYSALGKLQIVPALYGTLKPDGTTEYDPILYQTNGSTVIPKFDPINWYLDTYSGILFIQDPPSGYDSSAARPGFLEAFLYVGDYLDDVIFNIGTGSTGTTAINVGTGVGVFKDKIVTSGGTEVFRFKSLKGVHGISVTGVSDNILISYTGATATTLTALNGIHISGNTIGLGGSLTGDTTISGNHSLIVSRAFAGLFVEDYAFKSRGRVLIGGDTGAGTGGALQINTNGMGTLVPFQIAAANQIRFQVNTGGTTTIGTDIVIGHQVAALAGSGTQLGEYNGFTEYAYIYQKPLRLLPSGGNYSNNPVIIGNSASKGNAYKLQVGGGLYVTATSGMTDLYFDQNRFTVTGSTGWNFVWDKANKRFLAGNDCVVTGGSINYTFGDTNVNNGTFGSVMFGELSFIDPNVGAAMAVGSDVYIRAYGGKAFGRGSKVDTNAAFGLIGGIWTPGDTDPRTNLKVPQVNGIGAFGWYSTDAGQTNNHGALGDFSAILGGVNHNIPANATNSVVIGGTAIKVATGVTNTVHLPKVRIGLGTGGSLSTNNANNNLLVLNATTGEIEIRLASTISGGTGTTNVTASNGLSKVGQDVRLGGTVTGDTTISINSGLTFAIIAGEASVIQLSTSDGDISVNAVGGGIAMSSTNGFNILDTSPTELFILHRNDGGALTISNSNSSTSIIHSIMMDVSGVTFTEGNNKPFAYDSDYSANIGPRSIPDAAWVTGLTSSGGGITGGTNGLSIQGSGKNLGLGGTLTGNTLLQGNDNTVTFAIAILDGGSSNQLNIDVGGVVSQINNSTGYTNVGVINDNTYGMIGVIELRDYGFNRTFIQLEQNTSQFRIGSTLTGFTGLNYDGDYSANFGPRSIPDVAWVLAHATGGTGSSSQNVYSLKRIVTGSTSLTGTDFVLFCNAATSITLTLPSSPVNGQVYKIKDVSGNAGTNIITINGNGKNIDGSSTILINTNRGGVEICYDQTLNYWSVMNFVG